MLCSGVAWLLCATAWAQPVQDVPALTGRVIDRTLTLGSQQRDALVDRLSALERETGTQMVILLVPDTAPEDIAAYAQRVADAWKIGRRNIGDGLLVVLSLHDRRVRIEVSKALEGAIPDLAAKRLISDAMVPAFKQGDYATGLDRAIDHVTALVKREALPPPAPEPSAPVGDGVPNTGDLPPGWMALVALPIVSKLLQGLFGRALGALATGLTVGGLAWLLTQSLLLAAGAGVVTVLAVGVLGASSLLGLARDSGAGYRGGRVVLNSGAGSWSGGGGNGGFRSGGGGDFGGGGASGSW